MKTHIANLLEAALASGIALELIPTEDGDTLIRWNAPADRFVAFDGTNILTGGFGANFAAGATLVHANVNPLMLVDLFLGAVRATAAALIAAGEMDGPHAHEIGIVAFAEPDESADVLARPVKALVPESKIPPATDGRGSGLVGAPKTAKKAPAKKTRSRRR